MTEIEVLNAKVAALNAMLDAATAHNRALDAALTHANNDVMLLNIRNESLTTQLAVATAAEALQHGKLMRHAGRTNKIVEFDPMIPGDFDRALAEARDIGGIVRRAHA